MPTGAPEEFGVDTSTPANGNPSRKNYTMEKKRVWQRQEMFLEAYRKCGKTGKAAEAVGLSRFTVAYWQKQDIFSFNERMNMAHADYVENWEEWMDNRLENPQGNRGSDILGMFKLKAEAPGKYREEVKVIGTEAPIRMLEMLKELGKKELEAGETPALESPAIEGEYREVSVSGQEQTGKAPAEPGGAFLPPEGTGEPPQRPPQPKARNVPETNKPSGPPPRELNRR
jgi:hypothetical protein